MLVCFMKEMHLRRQESTLLQGKSGSITTRDLINGVEDHHKVHLILFMMVI